VRFTRCEREPDRQAAAIDHRMYLAGETAFGHFVSRHGAHDQPRSIVALHGFGFCRTFIRSESTNDRFQDVRVSARL
jgi:hypothetical protein